MTWTRIDSRSYRTRSGTESLGRCIGPRIEWVHSSAPPRWGWTWWLCRCSSSSSRSNSHMVQRCGRSFLTEFGREPYWCTKCAGYLCGECCNVQGDRLQCSCEWQSSHRPLLQRSGWSQERSHQLRSQRGPSARSVQSTVSVEPP